VRSGFVAFNMAEHAFDPPGPAASDVRLRAKADHQRIRNCVRDIGHSDHGDVIIIDKTKCRQTEGVLPSSLT